MMEIAGLADIALLYAARGGQSYGEGVTQLEHAAQCAVLAEESGAPPSLIAAALLHDIGHLLEDPDAAMPAVDDRHEVAGARALARMFRPAVSEPVALHVAAKRWLCATDATYWDRLSPASRRSLLLQGGPFDAAQADAFELLPHAREAVALRRFDDMGKRDEAVAHRFEDFAPLLRGLLTEQR